MFSYELATAQLEGDWHGSPGLTVLFDRRCPLCRRLKAWLGSQSTLVPIEFIAAGSPEATTRYPSLDHERTTTVLTVVASNGAVYEAERAWLACAWTLPRWQPVAEHLANWPALFAVKVIARGVDRHRQRALASLYGPDCDTCGIATQAPETPRG